MDESLDVNECVTPKGGKITWIHANDKIQNLRFIPPQAHEPLSRTPPKGRRRISRCFRRAACFGQSRGGQCPSPDSPLSGTELHYLCRSGSKHPTETARSEDSEMRMTRDEQRWRGPRLIPLVLVKPPWLEAPRMMSVHAR